MWAIVSLLHPAQGIPCPADCLILTEIRTEALRTESVRVPLLQATVQAALAALPGDAVSSRIPRTDPQYAEYTQYGEDALVTAIFCILICASFGTVMIRWLSPYLLEKVNPEITLNPTASPPPGADLLQDTGIVCMQSALCVRHCAVCELSFNASILTLRS